MMTAAAHLQVRELVSDEDIASALELMRELRVHLTAETFLATIRQQQQGGYRLWGGFDGSLVALAGARDTRTLARGRHWFVDDLVTAAAARGRGYGTAMLRWLAGQARSLGIERVYLDSRDTAMGFYRRSGFNFLTSVPCWIEVERLLD